MKVEYTMTMNSRQAMAVKKSVELLMRLKLGQYKELPFSLIDLGRKDFSQRRDDANELLKDAFRIMQGYKQPTEWKDEEWHTLYNILQALRYQIHLAEHPDTIGVDSVPPLDIGEVGIPECSFRKIEDGR